MAVARLVIFFSIWLAHAESTRSPNAGSNGFAHQAGAAGSRQRTLTKAISENTGSTIVAQEAISLNGFLNKFENNMDPRAGIGDSSVKGKLRELLYDFNHPYDGRYNNEYTRVSRMCRHILEENNVMSKRVRRTTGSLPRLAQEIGSACQDFRKDQTKDQLERVIDLDAEIVREVICLERGVTVGSGTCKSHFRSGRSVLMDDETTLLSDDIELPDVDDVTEFNSHVNTYCHERDSYEPSRIRRASHAATDFVADTLDYMNCMCDNKTTCGHLAQTAALSFGKDIGDVMAQELVKALDKGHQKEQAVEAESYKEEELLLAPGNQTHEEALQKVQAFKQLSPHHRVKRFDRPDVIDIPLAEFGENVGCGIIIHRDVPVQTFTCVFFDVVALELTFDWTNGLPFIEIVIKLCIPVVSDILDMIGKNFKPLASLLAMFDIEAGCFVLAKAYVDFYKGIFEIYSNVPQLSLIVLRAKLRSSFYIRFDPSRPTNDEAMRNELNTFGYRKFMRLHVTFRVEYFEIWKLWHGSWQCIWCKTLVDNNWPLGDDQSPLVKGDDPLPPADFRLAESQVDGIGRLEVLFDENWGTVCDDGWDVIEGDIACGYLGFIGYVGKWNETQPGTGDVHLGGLNCVGTETDLSKCPRTKDIGNTGCEHTEDVGIECLTDGRVCSEPLLEVYGMSPDQFSYSSGAVDDEIRLFSGGGWAGEDAGEHWLLIDLWFSHHVTGIRTQGHASQSAWTTKLKIEFSLDGTEWTSRQDGSGNEIMYTGNIDQDSIRSNFWYPPVHAKMLRLTSVESNGKAAFRIEVHGCTGSDGIMDFADAMQSSTMFGGFAKLALDRSTDNNFKLGKSCTHTMEEINPWWAMDLGREMMLEGVLILNRGDCCGHRLSNFHVEVGNEISSVYGVYGEMCFHYGGQLETNQKKLIRCEGTPRGRFVQVKKRGYGILTLCQVLIWASPTKPTCDFEGQKVDCGYSDQAECEEAGCCWQSSGEPKCFTYRTDVTETKEDCSESLYNKEPTTKVSTSSHITEGGDYSATRSRLDTKLNPDGVNNGANYQHGGWCAAMKDKHQFIQVEFSDVWTIRKIITQGADNSEDFVTKYMLYYSTDGQYWAVNGGILSGNRDVSTYAVNDFQRFSAKYIRINPVEWHGRICMRFEVLGCKVCEVSLIQRAPLAFFSASSILGDDLKHDARNARLDGQSGGSPYVEGGWTPKDNSVGEYVQIDFIGQRMISKVVTQGSSDKDQWVKKYSVEYSTDGKTYTSEGEYEGNTNHDGKVINSLSKPIMARSVRLKVVEYHGKATMRFDLLGCDPKVQIGVAEAAKKNGIAESFTPAFFFIDVKIPFTQAESTCKAHEARVATPSDLLSALEGGFEVCSPGWLSDGSVKQPQQHYTGEDRCGDAGDNDLGMAPPDKLFGVFCAKPGGYVFVRTFDSSSSCSLDDAKRECQKYGGRIITKTDAEGVVSDGYQNCLDGRYVNILSTMISAQSKVNFCNSELKRDITHTCLNNVYCAMPALNTGISPAGLLPFRNTQSGSIQRDLSKPGETDQLKRDKYRIYLPVVNHRQYLFGSILGGGLNDPAAAIIGEEPKDSGTLAPPVNFEEVYKDSQSGYYRAVCPEGYVSLGDVVIPVDKYNDPNYSVHSQYRCVRLDFVKQCTFAEMAQFMVAEKTALFQVVPNRANMDVTARFFKMGTSFSEGPPPETAYCLKRSHTVLTDSRLYSQFNENVLPAKLMITGATKVVSVVMSDSVTFFRPEIEPGQYIIGMVAVSGKAETYAKKLYVAIDQYPNDLLMPPKDFVLARDTETFRTYYMKCDAGYGAVGSLVAPAGEEIDEMVKSACRCVLKEYITYARKHKFLEGYEGFINLTSLDNDMDFFESGSLTLNTLKMDKVVKV